MGFLSKIFGNKEQPIPKHDENAAIIAELIGCEWRYIDVPPDSEELFAFYMSEAEKGKTEGYTPIILVVNDTLLESLQLNYEEKGGVDDFRKRSLSADISQGEAILKKRFNVNMEQLDEEFSAEDKYGEYNDKVVPATRFICTDKKKTLILVNIPVNEPWKIFAWIPFGGWNECPDAEDMMAVCKYWYDKYKAVPAVISSDELQMYVPSPVNDIDRALKIAEEQYAFCNDTVDQGYDSIKALASSLIGSDVWYFWWD